MPPLNRPLITASMLTGVLLFMFYHFFVNAPIPTQAQAGGASLTAPAPAAPDLLIAGVALSPTQPGAGDTGAIVVTVQNGGDQAATGFHLYLYVDPTTAPPRQQTPTTSFLWVDAPLAPGAVFTWTRTGQHFTKAHPSIYVWVDPPWENGVVESDEQNNLFPHPAAAITALDPARAAQGALVTVTVAATNTHFVAGVTTAVLGEDLTVANVNVLNPTTAVLSLTIAPTAKPGARPITLSTGAAVISKSAAFTVTQAVLSPVITHLHPASADPGTTVTVTVTAANTQFRAGRTDADFGAGITISQVQVISPTQAVVTAAIGAQAAPGLRTVTLTTGAAMVSKPNSFRVNVQTAGGAALYVEPTPATLFISETGTLAIVLAPGVTPVNGVQIHGKVDPAYLRLTAIVSQITPLVQTLSPIVFDPASGEFQFGAGELGSTITEPVTLLTLQVLPRQVTGAAGTPVQFLKTFPPTDVTGPTGSILAAAYDGRVVIEQRSQQARLIGRVDLQGRPFRPNAAWAIPVTVELLPESQPHSSFKQIVPADDRGIFVMNDLAPGDYTIRVKGEHTLANRVEQVTLRAGDNEIYLGTLLEGDVETAHSGNRVVVEDFSLLSGVFHRCRSDAEFLPNADLNEDGCIAIEDSTLVYANFNRQGDLVYDYTAGIPAPIGAAVRTATVSFATTRTLVAAGEALLLPLYLDPAGGDEILGATIDLAFDPKSVEVTMLTLAAGLADNLLASMLDNQQGVLRFSLQQAPGDGIRTRFQVATVQVRLKPTAFSARFEPQLDGPRATKLVGANGALLAAATGLTLINRDAGAYRLMLPVVVK